MEKKRPFFVCVCVRRRKQYNEGEHRSRKKNYKKNCPPLIEIIITIIRFFYSFKAAASCPLACICEQMSNPPISSPFE